jgi:hypothetical protein
MIDTNAVTPPSLRYALDDYAHAAYCVNGLDLAHKSFDGKPICVKPDTKIKLLNWGIVTENWPFNKISDNPLFYTIVQNNQTFDIKYFINDAKLKKITVNSNTSSIIVTLDKSKNGIFVIEIPRDVLDSGYNQYGVKNPEEDGDFIVLVDDEETRFKEVKDNKQRTLAINFKSGTKQIEIIGTYPI